MQSLHAHPNRYKKITFFLLNIRMSGKNVHFRDKKIKSDFYKNKKVTKKDDIDVKEDPYGTKSSFKYFIGYNDNDVIRLLCIKLP